MKLALRSMACAAVVTLGACGGGGDSPPVDAHLPDATASDSGTTPEASVVDSGASDLGATDASALNDSGASADSGTSGDAGLACAGNPLEWLADGNSNETAMRGTLDRGGPPTTVNYAAGHRGAPGQSFFLDGAHFWTAGSAGVLGFLNQVTDQITVEAWVRINDGVVGGTTFGRLVDRYRTPPGGAPEGFAIYLEGSRVRFAIGGLVYQSAGDEGLLAPGSWVHVLASYQGAGAGRIYLNGVDRTERLSAGTPVLATTLPVVIAGDQPGSDLFQGRMDNVRIYCTAFTESEALIRYTAALAAP